MDNRIVDLIQQHQRDDGHRSVFGNLASFLERQFIGPHATQVDPLGKTKGARFSAKARKTVNAIMSEAAVAAAWDVVQDIDDVREGFVKAKEREIKNHAHRFLTNLIGQ